jgi:hypothetical protein
MSFQHDNKVELLAGIFTLIAILLGCGAIGVINYVNNLMERLP